MYGFFALGLGSKIQNKPWGRRYRRILIAPIYIQTSTTWVQTSTEKCLHVCLTLINQSQNSTACMKSDMDYFLQECTQTSPKNKFHFLYYEEARKFLQLALIKD